MATTTFNKDFQLSEKDSKKFLDTLQASNKSVVDKNYKTALKKDKKYRSALEKALSNQ